MEPSLSARGSGFAHALMGMCYPTRPLMMPLPRVNAEAEVGFEISLTPSGPRGMESRPPILGSQRRPNAEKSEAAGPDLTGCVAVALMRSRCCGGAGEPSRSTAVEVVKAIAAGQHAFASQGSPAPCSSGEHLVDEESVLLKREWCSR